MLNLQRKKSLNSEKKAHIVYLSMIIEKAYGRGSKQRIHLNAMKFKMWHLEEENHMIAWKKVTWMWISRWEKLGTETRNEMFEDYGNY